MANPIPKRVLDLIFAIVASVLLSPLMALVAFAILVSTGFPIILRQERSGMGGERFVLPELRGATDLEYLDWREKHSWYRW